MELCSQKDRIRISIEKAKNAHILEKQRNYQEIKQQTSRTHLFKTTSMNGFFQ